MAIISSSMGPSFSGTRTRLRDPIAQEIAKSISASTGMTVSVDSLYYHLRKLREEEEAAAKKIICIERKL